MKRRMQFGKWYQGAINALVSQLLQLNTQAEEQSILTGATVFSPDPFYSLSVEIFPASNIIDLNFLTFGLTDNWVNSTTNNGYKEISIILTDPT